MKFLGATDYEKIKFYRLALKQ
jgi:hypothetical protein